MYRFPEISVAVCVSRLNPGIVFSISLLEECFEKVEISINPPASQLKNFEYLIGYLNEAKLYKRPNGIHYSDFGITWGKFGLFYCDNDIPLFHIIENEFVSVIDAYSLGLPVSSPNNLGLNVIDIKFLIDIFNPSFIEGKIDIENNLSLALDFSRFILDRAKIYWAEKFILRSIIQKGDQSVSIREG